MQRNRQKGPRIESARGSNTVSARVSYLLPLLLVLSLSGLSGCNALRFGLEGLGSEPQLSTFVAELGPFDLPPFASHDAVSQPEPLYLEFPADAWMHAFAVSVENGTGEALSAEILHHVKVLMPSRRELFHPIALRLIGAGAETRSAGVPPAMGVPVHSGEPLILLAMLHNPTNDAIAGARIRLRIQYSESPVRREPTTIFPFFLHVTAPISDSHYDLPPGYSEASWEASPVVAGRILGLGGHLHRYAASLRLEDVTTGRVLWRTEPRLTADGRIREVPRTTYFWSKGLTLRPDHVYRITAGYFNPTGEVLKGGGMGTIGGVFEPLREWPEVDPADELFAADLARELRHSAAHAHH